MFATALIILITKSLKLIRALFPRAATSLQVLNAHASINKERGHR